MRDIIIRNSDRFKSVFVSVNLLLPLEAKLNGKNALLAQVLKKSSLKYKTEKELERALASLYNTTVDVDVEKLGKLYNIRFGMEVLNVDYMDEKSLNMAKEIFCGLICEPNIENGIFNEKIFEREKRSLIERINEERDDKKKYALKELEKDMFEATQYSEQSLGSVENISKIANADLVEHYKYVKSTAKVVVTASGNLKNMEDFPSQIHKTICEKWGKNEIQFNDDVDKIPDKTIERLEKQDIAQSVLCIGLKLKDAKKEDMFAMLLYNSIMGGTPASKLFQNVREKESLAYFAKAMYNRFKACIYMYAGVDPRNQDKAKEVMLKQVDILKNVDITDIEFEAAKQNLISGYKEMDDTKIAIIKNVLNNEIFFEKEIDIQEVIKSIQVLTKDDVINVAKRIAVTNIFLLGGVVND